MELRIPYIGIVIAFLIGGFLLLHHLDATLPEREGVMIHRPTDLYCLDDIPKDLRLVFRTEGRIQEPYDYCDLAALCFNESGFDPQAIGGDGEVGVCQVLLTTYEEVADGDPWKPRNNVRASAKYLDRQINHWYADRTSACRLDLGYVSYRAGLGTILEAQLRSGGQACISDDWELTELSTRYYTKIAATKESWR